MAAIPLSLPPQFLQRAATAKFIVELELPVPPDHLDRPAVEDCRAIAAMLALARKNIFQVSWDAEEYAHDIPNTTLPNPDVEARLMAQYPALISREEIVRRHDENLPLLYGPGIVTDIRGNTLIWSLPGILSPSRQAKILADTRILEAQLTVDDVDLSAPPTKDWRTAHTFYWKGLHWTSGSTRLSPAGLHRGPSGSAIDHSPSGDSSSIRTQEWMRAFQESGGILDGILAVTHPELYETSQNLLAKIWRESAVSRPVLSIWPSCFTSLDIVKAVLELRGLGISLPYDAGSVALIMAKFLVHGEPEVRGDRVSYAFYMDADLYPRFKIPMPGMATASICGDAEDGVHARVQGTLTGQAEGMSNGFAKHAVSLSAAGPASDRFAAARDHDEGAAEGGAAACSAVSEVPARSTEEEEDVDMGDA